nr:hypothetical protein [Deltaproteobacteria bacterium]
MEALDGAIFGEGQPCFGCSPSNPFGMKLEAGARGRGGGEVHRAAGIPGARGVMHGGLVTTLADELAGWGGHRRAEAVPGFTGAIEARLLKPVRIGVEVEARHHRRGEPPDAEDRRAAAAVGRGGVPGMFSFVVLDGTAPRR